jgi:hypothetical protein
MHIGITLIVNRATMRGATQQAATAISSLYGPVTGPSSLAKWGVAWRWVWCAAGILLIAGSLEAGRPDR